MWNERNKLIINQCLLNCFNIINWQIINIIKKCDCPSMLIITKLFVNRRAYPFKYLGTTPLKSTSRLNGWAAVEISCYRISKINKL